MTYAYHGRRFYPISTFVISGCKITQLKLNLHPINRSFFRNEAKRAEIRHAGADTGSAGADARRGHGTFPPAHLPIESLQYALP